MRRHAVRQFTLIELIAVMGVMMLLAAVAIPAYSSLFSGRKTTLAANKLNGAIIEARSYAVSNKTYTALIFVKDGKGYKSFRLAEVYHQGDGVSDENDPDADDSTSYKWRRWASGSSLVLLPENTMIPTGSDNLGVTDGLGDTGKPGLPKIAGLQNSGVENNSFAIVFKPNGQLGGTGDKNVVVRFVEANQYEKAGNSTNKVPKLPLNINWLTCKTKFLDPVVSMGSD